MHYPGCSKFVDGGGTEDVGLGGADREASIAVIGAVSVIRRSAARREDPGGSARPMEYAVDGILWRDLTVQAEIDAVDARVVRYRGDIVRRGVGEAG